MGRIKEKWFICVLLVLIVSVVLLNTSDVQVQAASLKLNKTSIVLVKGTTYNLKVSGTSKKLTWSSKNKGIAAVKKTGSKTAKVTAKKTGTTYIYAKVAKKTLKCKVKVVNSKLNYTSKSIYKGSKLTLYTRGRGVGKWKSSNTSIATVTSKGKVTAKRVGKCYIYAYVGNSRLRCLLTVKNRPQPKPDAKLLTTEVTVDLEYPACIGIKGGTPTKWESTDTSIATVSYDKEEEEFTIAGVSTGTCEIHVYVGSQLLVCKVTVEGKKVEEEEKDRCLERDGIHLDSNGRDKLVYNHQIVESTNLAAMKNALLCDPIVRSFLDNYIHPGMADIEKLMAIERFYCDNKIKYGFPTPSAGLCPYCPTSCWFGYDQSAHSLLYAGRTVCRGFTKTTEYFCIVSDIPCFDAGRVGISDTIILGHAWNIVLIDGQWYNLDLTNSDWGNDTDVQASGITFNESYGSAKGNFTIDWGNEYDKYGYLRYVSEFPQRNTEVDVYYFRVRNAEHAEIVSKKYGVEVKVGEIYRRILGSDTITLYKGV